MTCSCSPVAKTRKPLIHLWLVRYEYQLQESHRGMIICRRPFCQFYSFIKQFDPKKKDLTQRRKIWIQFVSSSWKSSFGRLKIHEKSSLKQNFWNLSQMSFATSTHTLYWHLLQKSYFSNTSTPSQMHSYSLKRLCGYCKNFTAFFLGNADKLRDKQIKLLYNTLFNCPADSSIGYLVTHSLTHSVRDFLKNTTTEWP